MWTRVELKSKAKKFLSTNYITAFFVSLILMFFTQGGNNNTKWKESSNSIATNGLGWDTISGFLPVISMVVIIFIVIAIAIRVFVGYVFEVGARNYYLRGTEREVKFNEIAFGFKSDYYGNIIITMFIKSVYTFLWFLLLIIPGIIKAYAYSMVPYILSDNPNIDSQEAIALSESMTQGHKFDMFVLDLSFIGWYILGTLLFGIGVFFVHPYVDATKAQLYVSLRKSAIQNNLCSPDLLCYEIANDDHDDDWYDQV